MSPKFVGLPMFGTDLRAQSSVYMHTLHGSSRRTCSRSFPYMLTQKSIRQGPSREIMESNAVYEHVRIGTEASHSKPSRKVIDQKVALCWQQTLGEKTWTFVVKSLPGRLTVNTHGNHFHITIIII